MFMDLTNSLVELFYCCATADILTKLLQQCFLFFIVVGINLSNSQVSVYGTNGPTLVIVFVEVINSMNLICGYCKNLRKKSYGTNIRFRQIPSAVFCHLSCCNFHKILS